MAHGAVFAHRQVASPTRRFKEDEMLRFMVNAQTMVQSLIRKDEGQDLLEYALLVALIALGAVAAVTLAGDKVEAVFNAIAGKLPSA
jgi:pilus assembly protein Flp/PilA